MMSKSISRERILLLAKFKGDLGPSKAAAQRQVRTEEASTARMVTLMKKLPEHTVEEDNQIDPMTNNTNLPPRPIPIEKSPICK